MLIFNKKIDDKPIITSFCNKYSDSEKYYCSRTNQPKKYNKVNDKDCNNNSKYIEIAAILIIVCLELFYLILIPFFIPYLIITYSFPNNLSNQNNNNNMNIYVINNGNIRANSTIDTKITKMI